MATRDAKDGMGVDAAGGPVIDPTENVLALVKAANERQDDLRAAESRRIDELRAAESRRVDEQAALRAEYSDKLATAEAKRIDAIRAVDVNAVAVANQRSADQATVLANQVTQSAETLRGLVATTAAAQAQASQQQNAALLDRITTLEQAQYVGQGKQAVADPLQAEMVMELRKLAASQQQLAQTMASSGAGAAGEKSGKVSQQQMITWIVGLILFGLAMAAYLKK